MSEAIKVTMSGEPLFEPGTVSVTSGYLEAVGHEDIATTIMVNCLQRHIAGDFGEVCQEDSASNMASIRGKFGMILSVYQINTAKGQVKVYMMTDADHARTTMLLPSEY